MECELCGAECGSPVEVEVEGARMFVCEKCASMGKRIRSRGLQKSEHGAFIPYRKPAFSPVKKSENLDLGLSIASDFGERIRRAREKRGWKREELAKKLFEKESVMHRIEAGNFKPDDRLIERIESLLGISLREKEED